MESPGHYVGAFLSNVALASIAVIILRPHAVAEKTPSSRTQANQASLNTTTPVCSDRTGMGATCLSHTSALDLRSNAAVACSAAYSDVPTTLSLPPSKRSSSSIFCALSQILENSAWLYSTS